MKRAKTPTFLVELPLLVDSAQASRLHAHLEAGRCLYNALLAEANKRLKRMRKDPAWQAARAIPRTKQQERAQAFSQVRRKYRFSEYEMHEYAKRARCTWIAEHLDATMAQTLATRAYQAVNRVCLGKAKKVRFRSRGRGLDSVEGKRNDVGMRFVLDPNAGDGGFLIWNQEVIPALINWRDPVVQHGLRHPIKYVRLLRRKASSPRAKGADSESNRYFVQLILQGHAYHKPKHEAGSGTIGLDIGPSTLAIVPQEGECQFVTFCDELVPNARQKRRLQRKMERQRRANNPDNYDEQGRVKKAGKTRLRWKESKRYRAIRRQHATAKRKLAAHRKSLHGKLVHDIVKVGTTIRIEQTAFKGWQVWQEHRTSRPRDVCSAFGTHSCENWRHPERSFDVQDQTVPVLSWLWSLCQESALPALASLPVWNWSRAAGFVLGVPAGLSRPAKPSSLCHPAHLGRCGAAPASRNGGSATTCE
jgi:hypothetical protein